MKKILQTLSLLMLSATLCLSQNKGESKFNLSKTNEIKFLENKGQFHDIDFKSRQDVIYGSKSKNLGVYIRNTGVSYQIYRIDEWKETTDSRFITKEISKQTIYRIDLNWKNANSNFTTLEDEALSEVNNYYLSNCPNGVFNVKSYKGVYLLNLYSGINLHYYEKNGELKHDYIVSPNTDYKKIQVEVIGSKIQINNDGTILFNTPLGSIQEGTPIVYQNGKQLNAKWVLTNNVLSFEIENVNPTQTLIIDPITRLWGTYNGDTQNDLCLSTANDNSNNIYMVGNTMSNSGLIVTSGAHQQTFGGGTYDGFLAKFDSNGNRIWCTYYGGNSNEWINSCATDGSGNLYIVGHTSSTDNALSSSGAHQLTTSGGTFESFVAKFSTNGLRLWGTYYGGNNDDRAIDCDIDVLGNLYFCGYTGSSTGTSIATSSAHQSNYGGGLNPYDGFLVKLNTNGVRQWATYYGGPADNRAVNCEIDNSGDVYLIGYSMPETGTVIATQGTPGGGPDTYIAKFTPNGVRLWATIYGGNLYEEPYGACIDASNNLYISGETNSQTGTGITTSGAHQTVYNLGADAFLAKFNSNGNLIWGTYYGGNGKDFSWACNTDINGNVILGGATQVNNPSIFVTPGAQQTSYGGGIRDCFISIFNPNGVRLYGTYYGGSDDETAQANAICTFTNGDFYFSGTTKSNGGTAIATPVSFQSSNSGNYDAFIAKFSYSCTAINPTATVNSTVCAGSSLNFNSSITGTVIPTYSWAGPSGFTSNIPNPSITSASVSNTGIYTLTTNNDICVETATVVVNLVAICTNLIYEINETANEEINIFPNPSEGRFYIELEKNTLVRIIDVNGKLIFSQQLTIGKWEFNLENQPSGVYLIHFSTDDHLNTKKIIINN